MGAFTTMALSAASVGMQAYGQYQQGKSAKEAAEYNSAVYKQQAAITDIKIGITAEQYDRTIEQLRGATTVAISGQNRDLSGSALYVMEDNLTQAQMDKSMEIFNQESDKTRALSSAREYEIKGQRELRSSTIQAGTTLLTKGNDWYQKYGGFGKTT